MSIQVELRINDRVTDQFGNVGRIDAINLADNTALVFYHELKQKWRPCPSLTLLSN